MRAIILTCAWE